MLAMVLWGLEELFLKQALAHRKGVTTTFLINTIAGAVLSVLAIWFILDSKVTLISQSNLILVTATAITAFVGYIFFYLALQKQELSLISSLDEAWIIVSVIIATVAFGERLSALHLFSIFAVLIGAFLVSADFTKIKGLKFISGSGYTIFAIVSTGITVPLEKVLVGRVGEANAIFYLYALYFPLILIGKWLLKENFIKPSKALFKTAVFSGLADGSAFAFYLLAINSGNVSIIAPIVASSVVVTVILGRVYLKEKMTLKETVGTIFILCGVVVLSAISKGI